MGTTDESKDYAAELKGKAEEAAGKAAGDDELERKGQGDQAASKLRRAGKNIKGAFKDAT